MLTLISSTKKVIIIFFVCVITSCQFFNMSHVEICETTPSDSKLSSFDDLTIKITFTQEMNKTSTETNYSLSDRGINISGDFTWSNNNKTMEFEPDIDLDPYAKYKISVKSSAEDIYGNSLGKDYTKYIYINDDEERPYITEMTPRDNYQSLTDYQSIIFEFNEAISPDVFINSFSITPEISGVFTWSDGNTIFTFTPQEKYSWNQEYVVKISSELHDYYYNNINEEKEFSIMASALDTNVELLSIMNSDESITYTEDTNEDSSITYNSSVETDNTFVIKFDREIDLDTVKPYITFSPAISYSIAEVKNNYSDTITITPDSNFTYNETYILNIKKNIEDKYGNNLAEDHTYNFIFNAAESAPPYIDTDNIFFYNPETTLQYNLTAYSSFGDISFVEDNLYTTFMDLPLIVPDEASVLSDKQKLINSFRENFSLSATNSAATIDIKAVDINPDYLTAGYNNDQTTQITTGLVVRVYMDYTSNSTMGNIVLSLDESFSDGFNNLSETLSLTYNKSGI